MPTDLVLHGRHIYSVFELLGTNENDATYSLGWALKQSPAFRNAFVKKVFPRLAHPTIDRIELQCCQPDTGITDIELHGDNLSVVIEAKRGWVLPSIEQLKLYTARLHHDTASQKALVSLSECSTGYAGLELPDTLDDIPLVHLCWHDVQKLTRIRAPRHAEKRLLIELETYLKRIISMQNQNSNMVYVVSLGTDTPEWSKISWQAMVTQRSRYFHPVGNGYPKDPPNYVGFRYDGKLQSIHHVDAWEITTNVHDQMSELNPGPWEPHFIYTLGPPIIPHKTVKTGKIYASGRVWAALDLLLTCETVAQARDLTKQRTGVAE